MSDLFMMSDTRRDAASHDVSLHGFAGSNGMFVSRGNSRHELHTRVKHF